MTRVLLFDIDGTLLHGRGAGRLAMLRALRDEFNVEDQAFDIPFHGRTDRFLLRALLTSAGIEPTAEQQGRLRAAYRQRLPECLHHCAGELLPGIPQLLERLRMETDVELGLLTGNLPETAKLKLEHFGVQYYFWFGVYGDRHEDRRELAYEARQFLIHQRGKFDPATTLIIGDTPDDIACAKAIGAVSVACSTGGFSIEQLQTAGADHVFETLEPTDQLMHVLVGITD
jgi:phosphoglycolate phosphatase-like HAD superfamily hydrolase